ncbi:MAG TPA: hypothetical protein PLV95_01175 [Candidatus Pacearchaeota archaeon]|nr:hypothetical protein [Candidatus Pacearchaeota archaeon]
MKQTKDEINEIVVKAREEIIELAKEKAQKRGISPKKILRLEAGIENGKKKIFIKICERKPKTKKSFHQFEFFAIIGDYPLYVKVAF